MQPANDPVHWVSNPNMYSSPRSLICSLTWTSRDNDSDLVTFPSPDFPAGNISGITYHGVATYDNIATPDLAFQDDLESCADSYGDSHAWKVTLPQRQAHTMLALLLQQPCSQFRQMTSLTMF